MLHAALAPNGVVRGGLGKRAESYASAIGALTMSHRLPALHNGIGPGFKSWARGFHSGWIEYTRPRQQHQQFGHLTIPSSGRPLGAGLQATATPRRQRHMAR